MKNIIAMIVAALAIGGGIAWPGMVMSPSTEPTMIASATIAAFGRHVIKQDGHWIASVSAGKLLGASYAIHILPGIFAGQPSCTANLDGLTLPSGTVGVLVSPFGTQLVTVTLYINSNTINYTFDIICVGPAGSGGGKSRWEGR